VLCYSGGAQEKSLAFCVTGKMCVQESGNAAEQRLWGDILVFLFNDTDDGGDIKLGQTTELHSVSARSIAAGTC
jgi:hypothetical protein